jgi:hypothetical protein
MGFIIVLIVAVVILVACIVLNKLDPFYFDIEMAVFTIGTICAVVAVLCIVIIAGMNISNKREVSIYQSQKAYIESHKPDNDIEDAALTNKKIELNEWLYNTQYVKKNYPAWTFYPDEVLELKPIE